MLGAIPGEAPTGWLDTRTNEPIEVPLDAPTRAEAEGLLRGLPERLSAMAFNADPVYIDDDMMTVIEKAHEGFKPEPLAPTDLITEAGFMWLPRPFVMTDLRQKQTAYRAVLWYPARFKFHAETSKTPPEPGSTIIGRNVPTNGEERADGKPGVAAEGTGIVMALFRYIYDHDDYDFADDPILKMTPAQERKTLGGGELAMTHVTPWVFGADYPNNEAGLLGMARYIQCVWRLMQQTLAVRSSERASKPFRRRWEREDLPEKKVTVIRLRRPATPANEGGEPKHVDWTHRWLVGGHWRNQWYPSLSIHRQVWISPYVKGPADLPLDVRKMRVFEFVR